MRLVGVMTADTHVEIVMLTPPIAHVEFESMTTADPPPERCPRKDLGRLLNGERLPRSKRLVGVHTEKLHQINNSER